MVEVEEDSLIASYSRNRSKWQNDSSKFTPRGILPRETRPLPTAAIEEVVMKSEAKPVEIEDKSIILNYHMNRSRWQNDSSKFTPKGILPIDSSPLIGRRSSSAENSYKESNRSAEFLNDDRSVVSVSSSRRDCPTETELATSTMNNTRLLRNGENTQLVESLDIVPQYSFYAEYFGQDESVKCSNNVKYGDVADSKGDIDSLNGKGKLRPSSIASVVHTSEEGERNKQIPLRQPKFVNESSNEKCPLLVVANNKSTVEHHRIFAERTEERNRPITIVARGRSKTPPTKGVLTIDEREISKENILLYVDDTSLGKKVTPSSPEPQPTLLMNSETQQQLSQVLPTMVVETSARDKNIEDDTQQYTDIQVDNRVETSKSKTANNDCHLQTDNNSMEDDTAYPKAPFEPCLYRQKHHQDTSAVEDISSETNCTQKEDLVIKRSPTIISEREKVLQSDVQNKDVTYSPSNCEYLVFSKSSDDEPIFIEESDFHGTDEDYDKLEHSTPKTDEEVVSNPETTDFRTLREGIDSLNIVQNEINCCVNSRETGSETSPIINENEEILMGALNLTNIEEINEESSSPVAEYSIDLLDPCSDALQINHVINQDFEHEFFNKGTLDLVERDLAYAQARFGKCDATDPSVDLNDTIENLDYYGCTLMNSMNEEGFANSHDCGEEDDFNKDTPLMEAAQGKEWKLNEQMEDNNANVAVESTSNNEPNDDNALKNNYSADRNKISESRLQKCNREKDSLFDTDVILCDATAVSSVTEDEPPSGSRDPDSLAPELRLSKLHPHSTEGLNIGSCFSKDPSSKAHLKKSHLQSSESENDLSLQQNKCNKKTYLLKENVVKLNDTRHLQPLSNEKHRARLKLKTNVYAPSPENVSRKKLVKGTSSKTTKAEEKDGPLIRTHANRVKGETDFLLAELLAVSASKIVLVDEGRNEGAAIRKVVRPNLSSVHVASSDVIDAPLDEINGYIKGSQGTSRLSRSLSEEDVTMSKCVDEMKQFWDWAAKFANAGNSIPYFSSPYTTFKSGRTLAAEEGEFEPFGGGPELDICAPTLFQTEQKSTQSTNQSTHTIDRSVKTGENATDVSMIQKNNPLLPTSLATAIQQTSSKREAVKSNIIVLSGNILARTSFKNIFMKKWKKSFWIQFEAKLMLFRSMEDFKDWKCCHTAHPSDVARAKNANQHDSLVKFRIDFLEEMSRPGMRGFRATEVKSKIYEKGGPLIYNFKLEKWHDLGPSLLAAFASDKPEEIGFLRHALDECLQKCPENGLRSIKDLLVSGKTPHY